MQIIIKIKVYNIIIVNKIMMAFTGRNMKNYFNQRMDTIYYIITDQNGGECFNSI